MCSGCIWPKDNPCNSQHYSQHLRGLFWQGCLYYHDAQRPLILVNPAVGDLGRALDQRVRFHNSSLLADLHHALDLQHIEDHIHTMWIGLDVDLALP